VSIRNPTVGSITHESLQVYIIKENVHNWLPDLQHQLSILLVFSHYCYTFKPTFFYQGLNALRLMTRFKWIYRFCRSQKRTIATQNCRRL